MVPGNPSFSNDLHQAAYSMAPRTYECLRQGCGWKNELHPEEAQEVSRCHASLFGPDHVVALQETQLPEEDEVALVKISCRYQNCDWDEEVYPEVTDIWIQNHVDVVHGGVQYSMPREIELPDGDEDRQACEKALVEDIELVGVDSAAETSKTQTTEPLVEDEYRQACEMVLKKVKCPCKGCDWVKKFLWSPGTADMPPEVTEAYQHLYEVHDMYTTHPEVEAACSRLPKVVTLAWLMPKLREYAAEGWLEDHMGQLHPETEEARRPEADRREEEAGTETEEAIATAEGWLDPPEREGVAAAVKDRLNLQRQEGVIATAKEWLDPPEQEPATAEVQPNRRGQLETAGEKTETDETRIVQLETVGNKTETDETRSVKLETAGKETETDKTRIVTLETAGTETDETRIVRLETVEIKAETNETRIVMLETVGNKT